MAQITDWRSEVRWRHKTNFSKWSAYFQDCRLRLRIFRGGEQFVQTTAWRQCSTDEAPFLLPRSNSQGCTL